MKKIFPCLFALSVLLVGCGHDGGGLKISITGGTSAAATQTTSSSGGGGATQLKSLFSTWTDSQNEFSADLTHCAFNETHTVTIQPILGSACTCDVAIQGTQSSGATNFTNCSNATCGMLSGAGTYTNATSGLQVCNASGCRTLL